MLNTIIRGGRVVTPSGVGHWDVGIVGEQIAAVSAPGLLPEDGAEVIDASGKIVIPGGIEPHAHAAFRFVYPWAQAGDYRAAGPADVSKACALGGTTTVVDFANWRPGRSLLDAIANRDELYRGQSYIDYTFHTVLVGMGTEGASPDQSLPIPLDLIEQIPDVVEAGFNSVKVWTTNTTATRPRQMTDMGSLHAMMQRLAEVGGVLAVHAEDDDLVMHASRVLHAQGRTGTKYLSEAHPVISEDVSFRRVLRLAEWAKATVYLMHVSAKVGVDAIAEARGRGQPVYGETLHHYATFSEEVYGDDDGPLYHTYPSLKSSSDNDELWNALGDGRLQTIATDAIVCDRELKLGGRSIEDTVGGSPAVEERMGITYTETVVKRQTSLERFVDITSANAARILGMYPRKGAILPGSDADLVIFDPSVKRALKRSDLHVVDHSVWEGWEIRGWPTTTILRGRVIARDGTLLGRPTDGRLIGGRVTAPEILRAAGC